MKKRKIIAAAIIITAVMLSSFAFYAYQILYTPNVLVDQESRLFPVFNSTTYDDLRDRLDEEEIVNDIVSFSFLAKLKGLDESVKPGLYKFTKNMSNTEAINLLRSGRQAPIKLVFNDARRIEELSTKLTSSLQIDSADLAPLLLSDSVARSYGFDSLNFISMFIPNTYEVYWTSSARDILDRMKKEYDRYWTDARTQKAESIGLTKLEVATLASIVDSETNKMDEAPTIAGVYLNRLKKGYKLQADPTLKFAIGDFTIRRILNNDKNFDSPYNTYMYYGLPPGPIRLPSMAAMNAVLDYQEHNYLYFCAKDDFSGYHAFAKTYSQHLVNAKKFQKALNQQKIYR